MSTARSVTEIGLFALCTLRQAIPDLCAFQCHLLGMSFHIEPTMPAATADKKACAETLYASMLNSIADFRESQLIPWTDFAVFHHRHTKINWV